MLVSNSPAHEYIFLQWMAFLLHTKYAYKPGCCK